MSDNMVSLAALGIVPTAVMNIQVNGSVLPTLSIVFMTDNKLFV